jgi:hypothetical protein
MILGIAKAEETIARAEAGLEENEKCLKKGLRREFGDDVGIVTLEY